MNDSEVFFPTGRDEKKWELSSYIGRAVKSVPPVHSFSHLTLMIPASWDRLMFAATFSGLLAGEQSTGNVTNCEVVIICGCFFFFPFFVAEIGDFDEASDREHLAKNKYIPQQDALEDKIVEFHHNHM